jgi:hypothetical protein
MTYPDALRGLSRGRGRGTARGAGFAEPDARASPKHNDHVMVDTIITLRDVMECRRSQYLDIWRKDQLMRSVLLSS